MQNCARFSRVAVRASAASSSTAAPRTKALNITKRTLIDSNGGRAVRNVDGEIYEIVYTASNDSIKALCKSERKEYATEVGKDNRISIVLDSAAEMAGGAPSFSQLQPILKFSGLGPEAINGRVAMLAIFGVAAVEAATGRTLVEQAVSHAGAGAAGALVAAVTAASLAPLLLGRVTPERSFPDVNNPYPDTQLPFFWTALAETINGRVAMVGLVGILINEAIRGAPVFGF